MHHTKMMVGDERDNRPLLSNCGGPDLVLNSANLIPFDHIMQQNHVKGSSNFQLQPQQSENNLENRKIMLGLAQNGRIGPGMSLNGQGQQLSGSKQNQRQVLGESRPQSQNNRMSGVTVNQQHSQGVQSQQSQQFNQMHLNSLTHHNLGKTKQMNFSPGFT